ncbi:MAG: hypothetical protein HY261_09430 [Chloroflexi bacterium]|nr:hypothetical protein [Chloroflexota bacterium]
MDSDETQVLLKEYEACQGEATNTASWIWTSTTVFLAGWIAALGFTAAALDRIHSRADIWLLAVAAVVSQAFWISFVKRSLDVQQLLFLRQRQIEAKLGMLKSTAINAFDRKNSQFDFPPVKPESREELRAFQQSTPQMSGGWLIGGLDAVNLQVFKCLRLGGSRRAALYGLSLLLMVAWIVFASTADVAKQTASVSTPEATPTVGPTR